YLGMNRPISRRDILHGFGAVAASSFVPGVTFADEVLAAENAGRPYYPPALSGMRGNHDGSFDVAHALAREGKTDWGPVDEPDSGVYDLVVVGAGLSGLAAAHFYLKENPQARILLLDNHDDFGGHAKRNEFDIGGRTHLCYGGSQSLVSPNHYPEHSKTLLNDLGIDVDRLEAAYDQDFFTRHGLAAGIHFDKQTWGVDKVVRYELGGISYLPLAHSGLSPAEAVAQMPISDAARGEFLRLLTIDEDQLGMSKAEQAEYLYTISYREFLEKHLDIHEPEVFAVLQDLTLDYGAGIEAVAATGGLGYSGLPGLKATRLDTYEEDEPYIHHFPDGNATVARLLVRKMIPDAAPGSTAEDIVMAPFDYSKLDVPSSQIRLRLNSTVVRVKPDGEPNSAKEIDVAYVQGGQASRVRARRCVLACYNAIIPSLCPELPEDQREALSIGEKMPILYTNVVLNNWRAFKNLGIGAAVSSGSYHPMVKLDFPVSYGGQQFAKTPDEPITLTMERFVHRNNEGLAPRDQRRVGRYELLSTTFETMERNIREQLTSMLSAGGFDPANDIAAITVNRWAHGYADGFYDLGESWPSRDQRPNVLGRKPFGRITIANSDAGGSAMLESAVGQAWRAVEELG
ncbi:MAG: NAD(P)/FAD-dependent oxidoreductase, partial [Gammaproteobacteria bacterium]|nr:NAD(P)/FAD-dependent oxidoreductase [Gammaproteobacteria bacterium]